MIRHGGRLGRSRRGGSLFKQTGLDQRLLHTLLLVARAGATGTGTPPSPHRGKDLPSGSMSLTAWGRDGLSGSL